MPGSSHAHARRRVSERDQQGRVVAEGDCLGAQRIGRWRSLAPERRARFGARLPRRAAPARRAARELAERLGVRAVAGALLGCYPVDD